MRDTRHSYVLPLLVIIVVLIRIWSIARLAGNYLTLKEGLVENYSTFLHTFAHLRIWAACKQQAEVVTREILLTWNSITEVRLAARCGSGRGNYVNCQRMQQCE